MCDLPKPEQELPKDAILPFVGQSGQVTIPPSSFPLWVYF
jgi:hypothetical protein